MRYSQHYLIRKIHRYFGVIIGFQFLFWTVSGLFFSWSDIDEIHGDHFRNEAENNSFISPSLLSTFLESTIQELTLQDSSLKIQQLELRIINQTPYFWINNEKLLSSLTGNFIEGISKDEALSIASQHILPEHHVKNIEYLTEVDYHHEYRKLPLPAWVIHYEGDNNLSTYVSAQDGRFQRVRYDSWRNFDFLWMMHTMDYQSRDNINNWLLRAFSLLGLLTVLSGFLLYIYSSKRWGGLMKLISARP